MSVLQHLKHSISHTISGHYTERPLHLYLIARKIMRWSMGFGVYFLGDGMGRYYATSGEKGTGNMSLALLLAILAGIMYLRCWRYKRKFKQQYNQRMPHQLATSTQRLKRSVFATSLGLLLFTLAYVTGASPIHFTRADTIIQICLVICVCVWLLPPRKEKTAEYIEQRKLLAREDIKATLTLAQVSITPADIKASLDYLTKLNTEIEHKKTLANLAAPENGPLKTFHESMVQVERKEKIIHEIIFLIIGVFLGYIVDKL